MSEITYKIINDKLKKIDEENILFTDTPTFEKIDLEKMKSLKTTLDRLLVTNRYNAVLNLLNIIDFTLFYYIYFFMQS